MHFENVANVRGYFIAAEEADRILAVSQYKQFPSADGVPDDI